MGTRFYEMSKEEKDAVKRLRMALKQMPKNLTIETDGDSETLKVWKDAVPGNRSVMGLVASINPSCFVRGF